MEPPAPLLEKRLSFKTTVLTGSEPVPSVCGGVGAISTHPHVTILTLEDTKYTMASSTKEVLLSAEDAEAGAVPYGEGLWEEPGRP